MLGRIVPTTLGHLRSTYEREFKQGPGALDETREEFAERKMGTEALLRGAEYDLLAMGHWELPGSQCTVNRVLARALDALVGQYDVVIIDNEAGVEHIGRYASLMIDLLLVVAQPDAEFLAVAQQIWARCLEVRRNVIAPRLVLNRVRDGDLDDPNLQEQLAMLRLAGLPLAGALPESDALRRLSRAGRPSWELPESDGWRTVAAELICREVQALLAISFA
jgi:CO dehydrogenase maturation factor